MRWFRRYISQHTATAYAKLRLDKQTYAISKNKARVLNGGTTMDLTQQQIKDTVEKYKADIPVKVGSLAEDLDVKVIATGDLPEGISGSFSKEDDDYVIYVDESHPIERQRFTIAHELGHFYKHRNELEPGEEILNPSKKEKVMQRANHSSHAIEDPEARKKEIEADEFAAELLMPKEKFISVWTQSKKLRDVASFFQVSPVAANIRAMNLNLGWFD